MTTSEIDRLLAERGIRYNVSDEEFYDGNRVLDVDEVLDLLTELNLEELTSDADRKYDAAIPELWGEARLRFKREPETDDEAERSQALRELERLGWIYDPDTKTFHDGAREREWKDVIGLVPGMTCEDLTDDEK